jgi:DNA polymerase-4
LVVIEERDLPHCLHVLKLRDLCGVGSRMHKRLQNHGIFSVEELCAARRETLRMVWGGIEGERMYLQLKGEEVWRPVTKRSSLGHSHVLPPSERTEEGARAVLSRLLQKAAMRLRKIAHAARGLQVFVRHIGEKSWSAHTTFKESDDTLFFIEVFCFLWAKRQFKYSNSTCATSQPSTLKTIVPLTVGVNLFHIKPIEGCTFSLFEQDEEHRKLNRSVDELNEAFGKNAVYLGGAHHALHAAPDKIAFNSIPDINASDDARQRALEDNKARVQTQLIAAPEKPALKKQTPEKRKPCARLFW